MSAAQWTEADERAARIASVKARWDHGDRPVSEHDIEMTAHDTMGRAYIAVIKAAILVERERAARVCREVQVRLWGKIYKVCDGRQLDRTVEACAAAILAGPRDEGVAR